MAATKSRLGRGLSGLISGNAPSGGTETAPAGGPAEKKKKASAGRAESGKKTGGKAAPPSAPAPERVEVAGYREVEVARIEPNPYQPRKHIDEEQLGELVESIRSEGLLQPVVLRANGDRFQLIAGERRWRACRKLGMKTLPARVIEASDASSASISLIENLQREGLNPIEEAMGYASLMRDFDLTQEAVAERVGKGRATVANGLRLLHLEEVIQGYLSRGLISTGHAKVLLGVENPESRALLARKAVEEGWSVRALEKASNGFRPKRQTSGRQARPASEEAAVKNLEKRISSALNARVTLRHSPKKGRLIIEYFGNGDLARIMEKLGVEEG